MTEQAAQRVLTATEAASPLQDRIQADSGSMASEWQQTLHDDFLEEKYRALAARTVSYLAQTQDVKPNNI